MIGQYIEQLTVINRNIIALAQIEDWDSLYLEVQRRQLIIEDLFSCASPANYDLLQELVTQIKDSDSKVTKNIANSKARSVQNCSNLQAKQRAFAQYHLCGEEV